MVESMHVGQIVTNGSSIAVFAGDGRDHFLERLPAYHSYVMRFYEGEFSFLVRETESLRPATIREIKEVCPHWSMSSHVCPWCVEVRAAANTSHGQ